jgi:hypothetical protein
MNSDLSLYASNVGKQNQVSDTSREQGITSGGRNVYAIDTTPLGSVAQQIRKINSADARTTRSVHQVGMNGLRQGQIQRPPKPSCDHLKTNEAMLYVEDQVEPNSYFEHPTNKNSKPCEREFPVGQNPSQSPRTSGPMANVSVKMAQDNADYDKMISVNERRNAIGTQTHSVDSGNNNHVGGTSGQGNINIGDHNVDSSIHIANYNGQNNGRDGAPSATTGPQVGPTHDANNEITPHQLGDINEQKKVENKGENKIEDPKAVKIEQEHPDIKDKAALDKLMQALIQMRDGPNAINLPVLDEAKMEANEKFTQYFAEKIGVKSPKIGEKVAVPKEQLVKLGVSNNDIVKMRLKVSLERLNNGQFNLSYEGICSPEFKNVLTKLKNMGEQWKQENPGMADNVVFKIDPEIAIQSPELLETLKCGGFVYNTQIPPPDGEHVAITVANPNCRFQVDDKRYNVSAKDVFNREGFVKTLPDYINAFKMSCYSETHAPGVLWTRTKVVDTNEQEAKTSLIEISNALEKYFGYRQDKPPTASGETAGVKPSGLGSIHPNADTTVRDTEQSLNDFDNNSVKKN